MYLSDIKGKQGLAKLYCSQGKIYARLPKDLSLALGKQGNYRLPLIADLPENQAKAEAIIRRINDDIQLGEFDYSLKKYSLNKKIDLAIAKECQLTIVKIIEDYNNFYWETARPGTRREYAAHLRLALLLEENGIKTLDNPIKIVNELMKHRSGYVVFKFMQHLNAASKLALGKDFSKLSDYVNNLRKSYSKPPEKREIKAFNREQQEQVIQAFKDHEYYSHYWELIAFCFYVGCRPSEAYPLTWEDFSDDYQFVCFNKAYVYSEKNKYELVKGLKRADKREIRLTPKAHKLIKEMAKSKKSDTLVFPSPSGIYINHGNFTKRAWKSIMSQLGLNHGIDDGFTPYKTRHTFATNAIEIDGGSANAAKYMGNSESVCSRYYNAKRPKDVDSSKW